MHSYIQLLSNLMVSQGYLTYTFDNFCKFKGFLRFEMNTKTDVLELAQNCVKKLLN